MRLLPILTTALGAASALQHQHQNNFPVAGKAQRNGLRTPEGRAPDRHQRLDIHDKVAAAIGHPQVLGMLMRQLGPNGLSDITKKVEKRAVENPNKEPIEHLMSILRENES